MTTPPQHQFVKCSFYTPIGATNVRLNQSEIVGDWKNRPTDYFGERGLTLAQRFAGIQPDPQSIFKFTQRWGSLTGNPYDGREGFQFAIDSWVRTQASFQKLWRMVQRNGCAPLLTHEPVVVEFHRKAITMRCPDLYTFMCFELLSGSEALRVCKRSDCPHPFFFAHHGKEQYCSTECSNWAQSIWKKRWHEEQRQRRVESEESDGTQEAR